MCTTTPHFSLTENPFSFIVQLYHSALKCNKDFPSIVLFNKTVFIHRNGLKQIDLIYNGQIFLSITFLSRLLQPKALVTTEQTVYFFLKKEPLGQTSVRITFLRNIPDL